MKYVKSPTGVLIKATDVQIVDESVEKFEIEETKSASEDPIALLTDLVKNMALDVRGTVDTFRQEMDAFKNAQSRGFFAPEAPENKGPDYMSDELKECMGQYDLAYQGKRLTDKLLHPNHTIDEPTRIEMAKYYALFLRANVFQERRAQDLLYKNYGWSAQGKTPVGDSGNVFPLPNIIETEILAFARESSVLLQYGRVWPMTSEKQTFPSETSAVSVAWGNTTSESEPGETDVELEANELSAYSVVKNATLADARSDIVSWLTEAMAEAAGQELDNQAFNGTGTPFYGILGASGAGYSVTLTGTAFQDVTFTALSEMISKLDGLKKQGARFWMSGGVFHWVRSLKDDQNRPIFVDTVGAPQSGTILGYPYTEVIKCPTTTGSNTAFIAFGNLRYYAVGNRLDSASLSIDPYGLWTTNRTRYKLYQRWGMKCGLRNGLVRMLTGA